MELEKIADLDQAFNRLAEHVFGNPLVDMNVENEALASASPDMLAEADSLYDDFFREEESDVFGKIEVRAGREDGSYLALTRTVKVSDVLTVSVQYIRDNTAKEKINYNVGLLHIDGAREFLYVAGDSSELDMTAIASVSTDTEDNGSSGQLEDSLDTMRRIHAKAFGTD